MTISIAVTPLASDKKFMSGADFQKGARVMLYGRARAVGTVTNVTPKRVMVKPDDYPHVRIIKSKYVSHLNTAH